MYKSVLSLILILFTIALNAQADANPEKAEKIITDRPTESITPYLLGKGMLQIETGFLQTSGRSELRQLDGTVLIIADLKDVSFNTSLFRYGLSDKVELRIVQGIGQQRSGNLDAATQLSATNISAKIRLGKNIAFIPYFEGPLFTRVETPIEAGFRFAMQSQLGEKWNLTYNAGANFLFRENSDDVILSALATVALGYEISPKLQSFVELSGFIPVEEGYDPDYRMGLGLKYLVNNTLQLDAFGGFGLTTYSQSSRFGFGASFQLGKK